jgi:uncharacterized OB-fold protein
MKKPAIFRCLNCGAVTHPARKTCPTCGSRRGAKETKR